MTDENENRPTRAPLTLKPRAGGSVSTGTVKQSFSHGRTKTVVVETKRPRMGAPNVIHTAFLAGRGAERWTTEVERLAGFRPLFPQE